MKLENKSRVPFDQILDLLEGVRKSGEGFSALCPAHGDRNNSLSVSAGRGGRVVLNCFAGCDPEDIIAAIGLVWEDLFPAEETKVSRGLTLDAYAAAKGLTKTFLGENGVDQIYLQGTPVVRIPYFNTQGEIESTRMRLALEGRNRFRWKTGSKAFLYGLWRLRDGKSKYVIVVEGESDCYTLWSKNFPGLGLPGASIWNELWIKYFERFERVYFVIEPDDGGDAILEWLRGSKLNERARLVTFANAKDVSDLYLSDPPNFSVAMKAAMKSAIPWSEREKSENRAKKRAAWKKCKRLALADNILEEFLTVLEANGVAGERRAAGIIFLALSSRFLSRPVSLVVTAPSSAGKSFVVEEILFFFPPSAFYALTAMSERALAYSAEPLRQRFLVLYEGAALQGDFLNYIVRSLLSEGRLRYETVEKTDEGLRTRLIEREGPTGLITTTTAVSLHPENETRHLTVTLSDTRAQTQRILRTIASQHSGELDGRASDDVMIEWRALQEWLEYANHEVVVPYAVALAELIPPVAVRLRRDFTAILNLIEAHALLHQATRTTDDRGRIMAKIADYRAVTELVGEIVSEGIEQTVKKTIRDTVNAVAQICSEASENGKAPRAEPPFATVFQVKNALKLDRSAASRRIKQALMRGYLQNLESKRGQPHRLIIGDELPEQTQVLPTPEQVREQWQKRGE